MDAAAPENNLHHTSTYRTADELLDDIVGRGAGDPDMYGYPGEPTATHVDPPIADTEVPF